MINQIHINKLNHKGCVLIKSFLKKCSIENFFTNYMEVV